MRNFVLPLALLIVISVSLSCVKSSNCSPKSPASESGEIQAFASTSGINAVADPSGLYYEIVSAGSGPVPTINSTVAITYTGMMLNGTIFDQRSTPNNTTADPPWRLSDLIEGWRIGLPLIHQGGHIKLIVPSAMAYGCTGYGTIPGNSILFFDITLVAVH